MTETDGDWSRERHASWLEGDADCQHEWVRTVGGILVCTLCPRESHIRVEPGYEDDYRRYRELMVRHQKIAS